MLGVTQNQLAAISGVGINTLTKIERGEGNPSINVLTRVLDSLGLELVTKVKAIE
jgi:transcriptional regulator with XRE-family HTH domain